MSVLMGEMDWVADIACDKKSVTDLVGFYQQNMCSPYVLIEQNKDAWFYDGSVFNFIQIIFLF